MTTCQGNPLLKLDTLKISALHNCSLPSAKAINADYIFHVVINFLIQCHLDIRAEKAQVRFKTLASIL